MFQSHLSRGSTEDDKKADTQVEAPAIVAANLPYLHYQFGTKVKRKPYGFEKGLGQMLAEKGIYKKTPVYDIPDQDLIFTFIESVLQETKGPTEDPLVTMNRVKDQVSLARLEPFANALRILQDENESEPEYLQKYLRKTRKKAETAKENPVNIVSRHLAEVQSELYDNFKIIFEAVTPYVMRTLLERIDWEWRDALRAERREMAHQRKTLTGKEFMAEEDRQEAIRKARRIGETANGFKLIKAYMQRVRPELARQTEPEYDVSPKLIVRVDPLWDDKLPPASAEKKKDVLHKVICLLGENISSEELSKLHISRVTKTLEGYKVWFMNEVSLLSSTAYLNYQAIEDSQLQQAKMVSKGRNGFSVSAMIAAPPAVDTPKKFHRTFNPLFVRIKTTDLNTAKLSELSLLEPSKEFEDRFVEQVILDSTERMIAVVNKDVDDSAKLEMNMNVAKDAEISSVQEDAKAHLEKIKIQLQIFSEQFRMLSQDSSLDLRARVLHNQDNVKLFDDVTLLREKVVQKIKLQILDVDQQHKQLELLTQEMSSAFNEKVMADDVVAAVEAMAIPLRVTLNDFFGFHSSSDNIVFARLCNDLVVEADRTAITSPALLGSYIKSHATTKQLLDKINYILLSYPKQKSKEAGENKALADFAARLKANLIEQLDGLPAFELGKMTGGKLIYNPGKLIEQLRYEHESKIQSDKKALLEKISQVGMVRDEMSELSHAVQTLGHRFENERGEIIQIQKVRNVIDKYIKDVSEMLNAISHEVGYMVPEFFASMRIFSPQLKKKDESHFTEDLNKRQVIVREIIDAISAKLKKLINMSAALNSVSARINDLDEFERRFQINKNFIENLKANLNEAVAEVIGLTIPLINQKKVLDHTHEKIYAHLKAILLDDVESWKVRSGGEIIMVDDIPYRVPERLAAMIRAIQLVEQEDSLQPGDKLKSILSPQIASPHGVATKGMFKALAALKKGLTNAKPSEKALRLFTIIDELQQLAKTSRFNTPTVLAKPLDELTYFIQKKPKSPVASPKAKRVTDKKKPESPKRRPSRSKK